MSMFRVRGSLLRKIFFWAHLCCGVAAGLVILAVSATGVLLAYQAEITAHAAAGNRVALSSQAPLTAQQLADAVRRAHPDAGSFSLVFDADPRMPVTATRGRESSHGRGFPLLLNPYTGEPQPDAAASTRQFFRTVENVHRWLGGRPRGAGASIVAAANLLFVLMTLSGLYLWFPDSLRWRTLRGLLVPRWRYINAKVRDFSWHHVFGVWMLIPLFLISTSGVVMSYSWANNLLFAAFGETPPVRQGPPGAAGPGGAPGQAQGGPRQGPEGRRPMAMDEHGGSGENRPDGRGGDPAAGGPPPERASLDALLAAARTQVPGWRTLTLPAAARGRQVEIVAEMPAAGGGRPPRRQVVLGAQDAHVISVGEPRGFGGGPAGAQSPAQRLRVWLRFTHTGEQYGIAGKTVAALASLLACLLVYTGLALAFRRLLLPLWRREPRAAGRVPAA